MQWIWKEQWWRWASGLLPLLDSGKVSSAVIMIDHLILITVDSSENVTYPIFLPHAITRQAFFLSTPESLWFFRTDPQNHYLSVFQIITHGQIIGRFVTKIHPAGSRHINPQIWQTEGSCCSHTTNLSFNPSPIVLYQSTDRTRQYRNFSGPWHNYPIIDYVTLGERAEINRRHKNRALVWREDPLVSRGLSTESTLVTYILVRDVFVEPVMQIPLHQAGFSAVLLSQEDDFCVNFGHVALTLVWIEDPVALTLHSVPPA